MPKEIKLVDDLYICSIWTTQREWYAKREKQLKREGHRTDRINKQIICKKCGAAHLLDLFTHDVAEHSLDITGDNFIYLRKKDLLLLETEICLDCHING